MSQQVEQRTCCQLLLEFLLVLLTALYRRTFQLYTWKPLKAMRAVGGDHSMYTRVALVCSMAWQEQRYDHKLSVILELYTNVYPPQAALIPLMRDFANDKYAELQSVQVAVCINPRM